MTHRRNHLPTGNAIAGPQTGRNASEVSVERVNAGGRIRMLQHDIAAIAAVACARTDVANNARHRRQYIIGRLAVTVVGHCFDVDAFVELRSSTTHTTKGA